MGSPYNTGGAGFSSGANDPIINIFTETGSNGEQLLKVQRLSGRCGYVTKKGISTNPDNAAEFSGVQTITLNTFAELQAYEFKSGTPVYINIINDEDKNQDNTSYSWTGSTLKWNAEVVDEWQPII